MMRLVISPSHRYHFGRPRQQQEFQAAITSTSTSSSSTLWRINWTFSWSLDKQQRKRNNEHKLAASPSLSPPYSSSCSKRSATTTTVATSYASRINSKKGMPASSFLHQYHLHNSSFSCSPLLSLHHILPSRRLTTATSLTTTAIFPTYATGTQTHQTHTSKSSSSAVASPLPPHHSFNLARIGDGHGKFQGKMNILNRRLHSSSSSSCFRYTSTTTRSLFSISARETAEVEPSLSLPSSSSSSNVRFISTSCAPGENSEFFHISPEIRQALKENVPVVALESAIITHGMPYPDNIDTAFRLESIIREHGVVPATVGVVRGRVTVGLSPNEIESLGEWANRKSSACGKDRLPLNNPVVKVSRRDIPFAIAHKLSGGTTVSGTIIAAVKAGIPIFATGGLGGVHRGAETTFDISADLKELGRNPIGVVSAGVKSILDIGKTLEYMETEGICVAVLKRVNQPAQEKQRGQQMREHQAENRGGNNGDNVVSDGGGYDDMGKVKEPMVGAAAIWEKIGTAKFPSFFTSESPFTAPYSVGSEKEAALLIHSAFQFQLASGVLIAVPIPKETETATGKVIEAAIKSALEVAEKNSVQGKDMTPFLLGEVNRLTGGLSLKANKHLIENNVRCACGIATHLTQLKSSRGRPEEERISQEKYLGARSSSIPFDNCAGKNSVSGHENFRKNTVVGQRLSPENEPKSKDVSSCGSNLETWKKRSSRCNSDGNASGKNSSETLEGSSLLSAADHTTLETTHRRHNRPIIIGGTSLDLVLAIQEQEIVD